jgi:hypothetical protein
LGDRKSHFRVLRKFFNVGFAHASAFAANHARRISRRQSKPNQLGRPYLAKTSVDLPIPSESSEGMTASFDGFESAGTDDFVGKGDKRPSISRLCHKFDHS